MYAASKVYFERIFGDRGQFLAPEIPRPIRVRILRSEVHVVRIHKHARHLQQHATGPLKVYPIQDSHLPSPASFLPSSHTYYQLKALLSLNQPKCLCQERAPKNKPSRAYCNMPKHGVVSNHNHSNPPTSQSLQTLTQSPHRKPSPSNPARNSRRRPARPPIPDHAYAVPAHPALQHLPQHQRLQNRQCGPDICLERGVPRPRRQEEADFRQQVWRERPGARRYGWIVHGEHCGWWFGVRVWQEGDGRCLSEGCTAERRRLGLQKDSV